jgi:hypothetical protein
MNNKVNRYIFLVVLGLINFVFFQNCSQWKGNIAVSENVGAFNTKPLVGGGDLVDNTSGGGNSHPDQTMDPGDVVSPPSDFDPQLDTGDSRSGSTDSGSTDSGSTDSGSTDSGSTDSGSTDSGSADSGSTDSGSTDSGSTGSETNVDIGEPERSNIDSGDTRFQADTISESDQAAFIQRCFTQGGSSFKGLGALGSFSVSSFDGNQSVVNGGKHIFVNFSSIPVVIDKLILNGGKNFFCGNFSIASVDANGGAVGFYAEKIGNHNSNAVIDVFNGNGGNKHSFTNTLVVEMK